MTSSEATLYVAESDDQPDANPFVVYTNAAPGDDKVLEGLLPNGYRVARKKTLDPYTTAVGYLAVDPDDERVRTWSWDCRERIRSCAAACSSNTAIGSSRKWTADQQTGGRWRNGRGAGRLPSRRTELCCVPSPYLCSPLTADPPP
jgi:hypothetical protein